MVAFLGLSGQTIRLFENLTHYSIGEFDSPHKSMRSSTSNSNFFGSGMRCVCTHMITAFTSSETFLFTWRTTAQMCGHTGSFFLLQRRATQSMCLECLPTTSAQPVSYGAIRFTVGTFSGAQVTSGGSIVSVLPSGSTTSSASIISEGLRRIGKYLLQSPLP